MINKQQNNNNNKKNRYWHWLSAKLLFWKTKSPRISQSVYSYYVLSEASTVKGRLWTVSQRFQFVKKLFLKRFLVWLCCTNSLCSNWHIKAKTIITGAEFQPDTHPLTDEIRLSHKCNLPHVGMCLSPPPTHRLVPLRSAFIVLSKCYNWWVSWTPPHLLLLQTASAHSNVTHHLWSIVCALSPPTNGGVARARNL